MAGRDDDLVPWSNNQYLDDLVPNSDIHSLNAGHFAWEQAPEEYGRLVTDWVTGASEVTPPLSRRRGAGTRGGDLIPFARMDKVILGSIDIALAKAKTSMAAMLGITEGNQRVLLHRGRTRLRAFLAAEMG